MQQAGREGGDVAEAEGVVVGAAVVAGFGERDAAYADVGEVVDVGAVGDEGYVFGAELPVNAGGADPETLRRGDVGYGAGLVAGGVEGDGVDDGEVVDAAVLESDGEVGAGLANGAVELEAVALLADGGAAEREGVAGVHPLAAVGGEEGAVEGGGSGLGVNFDAAAFIGGLAVFGGEEVGVDLDEGDGAFGGQWAVALEAVDGDGGVGGVGAGGGGELLELAGEVVRVVGEGLELVAGEGGAVGSAERGGEVGSVRLDVDFGGGAGGKGEGEVGGVVGYVKLERGEAGGGNGEVVAGGGDAGEAEAAVVAAGARGAGVEGKGGSGDERAGGVDDGAGERLAIGAGGLGGGGLGERALGKERGRAGNGKEKDSQWSLGG